MSTTSTLLDAAARGDIVECTDRTLFVNAGAGSGKTRALVDRIRRLVLVDRVPLRHIAAVTFTDKAGAELRDRLRATFERAYRSSTGADREIAEEALNDLDAAAIGTLHAFAQRLLNEHPIEVRLPPRVEVLDEVGSSLQADERWNELRAHLLEDDSVAEPLLLGMAVGIQLEHIRQLTAALSNDWDLLEERVLATAAPAVRPPELTPLVAQAHALLVLEGHCLSEDDKLRPPLAELNRLIVQLEAAIDTETALGVLQSIARLKFSYGQAKNWTVPVADVRRDGSALVAAASAVIAEIQNSCLRALTHWTARSVLDMSQGRRADGRLEFHDLLVLARELLRASPDARADLHERYQRLLLDEFQDTDPIQVELAVRIAGGRGGGSPDWHDVVVPPGRLFVVGDPKQSIYRFRRASIATYLDVERHVGDTVSLTANFRSTEPILTWVNEVFGRVITPVPDAQPTYEVLGAARTEAAHGPAVTVLGTRAHDDLPRAWADELRHREATDVAGVITTALAEGWHVQDRRTGDWRHCRLEDIAVLVPARTSLLSLEDALEAAGIPYRAEASSLVYQSEEIRSLLACARAVADPTDQMALLQVLRSPLFGCSDADLWLWKQAGGYVSIWSEVDAPGLREGPVGGALAYLRSVVWSSRWLTPSELLSAIVEDRRMYELAATRRRTRDSWRRLRFVVDQARAWSESSSGGLREYVAWATHLGQETRRAAEAVLPETDTDSVRIMTIHAAKGLEFPITIMSGLTARGQRPRGLRLIWTATGYEVKVGSNVATDEFDNVQPIDEQMDELEKRRLLYVAATRARDHLVVSLHRDAKSQANTAAQLLATVGGAATAAGAVSFDGAGRALALTVPAREPITPPPPYEDWLAAVHEARQASTRPASTNASGLEGTEPEVVLPVEPVPPGAAKGPRDLELPPWSKGRYGSAVGRAVHAVLQGIDLRPSGEHISLEIGQAVAAQCLVEGLLGHEEQVLGLVKSALRSELVQRAAVREHWREQYVATVEDDGTVLEGYIDLIFRDDDGALVIIDYKTDAIPAGAVDSRVTYYRPQLDAYARCLSAAVGARVSTWLLFLHPTAEAVAVDLP